MSATVENVDQPGKPSPAITTATLISGAIGLAVGLALAYPVFFEGGRALAQGTNMAWGLPVATYAFLALGSFGLSMVAAVGGVFGLSGWNRITPRLYMLALAVSFGAIAALAMELGHPIRAIWAIPLNMQIQSPLLWMGVFWGVYVVCLLAMMLRLRRVDALERGSRRLAVVILLTCLGALFTQGLVYGMMSMRPVWYGIGTPLYYMYGAILTGVALALLFINLTHGFSQDNMVAAKRRVMRDQLPVIFLVALVGYAIVVSAKIITGLWAPTTGVQVVYEHMIGTGLFWFEVLGGVLLPIALMAAPAMRTRPAVQGVAAVLAVVGLFIARYEFTVSGQQVPLFKGSWVPGLVEYSPNIVEWGILVTGAFLALTIYAVADRFFNTGPYSAD